MISLPSLFLQEHSWYHTFYVFEPTSHCKWLPINKKLKTLCTMTAHYSERLEHNKSSSRNWKTFFTFRTFAASFKSRDPSSVSWIKLMNFFVNRPAMCIICQSPFQFKKQLKTRNLLTQRAVITTSASRSWTARRHLCRG